MENGWPNRSIFEGKHLNGLSCLFNKRANKKYLSLFMILLSTAALIMGVKLIGQKQHPYQQAAGQSVPPPNKPTGKKLVGAFYMPQADIRNLTGYSWDAVQRFPERKPLLGYYNGDNPEVMDWHLKWALEHGIDFFVFVWNRCTNLQSQFTPTIDQSCINNLGKPISAERLYQGAEIQAFFASRYFSLMKLAILLTGDNQYGPLFSDLDDLKNNLMPFLIENYLQKPNYLRVNGKPLLFIYNVEDWEKMAGSFEEAKRAFQVIRESVKNAGLGEVILLGEDRSFTVRDLNHANKIRDLGIDYLFAYNVNIYYVNGQRNSRPNEQEAISSQKQSYDYLKNNSPLPFIITASPFSDSYPFDFNDSPDQPRWWLSADGYKQVLQNVLELSDSLPPTELGSQIVLVDAWNEIGEGHFLIPSEKTQFTYLNAIRQIMTVQDNTPDESPPLLRGFGPYDSYYQTYLSYQKEPAEVSQKTYEFISTNDKVLEGDYIDVNLPMIQHPQFISFGGWFNPSLSATTGHLIPINKEFSFHLVFNPNGSGHCTIATTNNSWYSPGTVAQWSVGTIKAGQWQHLFCVYDGKNVKVFYNGDEISVSSPSISGGVNLRPHRIIMGGKYIGGISHLVIEEKEWSRDMILSHLWNTYLLLPTPTPPPTPTPSPTPEITPSPTENNFPRIVTQSLPSGKVKFRYSGQITAEDKDIYDVLSMQISSLPPGLTQDKCLQKIDHVVKRISCTISGIPEKSGRYQVKITVSDNRGGSSSGNFILQIKK